jgi:hypothetical protein
MKRAGARPICSRSPSAYYLRHSPVERGTASAHDTPGAAGTDTTDEYLCRALRLLQRRGDRQRFNDWYDRQHVAGVLDSPGFERATRYGSTACS